MAKSVSQVRVAVLVGHLDVVLGALIAVEVRVHWSCISLLHPVLDVRWSRVVVVEHRLADPSFLVAEHVVRRQIVVFVAMILHERHLGWEVVP